MARRDEDTPDTNDRLLALLERQQQTMQESVERSRPKENPNYVAQSLFLKPDGEPWAKDLKCQIYLNSILLNRTPLTKAEVDALNRLAPVEKARVEKVDGSTVLATVRPREDAIGRVERLTIELPMKKDDNPQHYPKLDVLALQLVAHAAA